LFSRLSVLTWRSFHTELVQALLCNLFTMPDEEHAR